MKKNMKKHTKAYYQFKSMARCQIEYLNQALKNKTISQARINDSFEYLSGALNALYGVDSINDKEWNKFMNYSLRISDYFISRYMEVDLISYLKEI